VVCGFRGHVLPAADAAELRAEDWALAFERDGVRWCHCLRCAAWSPVAKPREPAREYPPDRHEIQIPDRGKALRDKIVLRLIALDRVLHFLVLGILGIAVLALAGEPKSARGNFTQVLASLQRAIGGGPVQARGRVGLIGELDKLFSLQTHTLHVLGAVLLGYALLEGTEAVGLWFTKRWAEYLTFVATAILLPFEVYELVNRVSALKIIGFLINAAVVVYLISAKRLFGIRGGGAVDERRRKADTSWEAIERSAPRAGVEV
jgi:uncharacterized membrane protein (DUF2068 family)